MTEGPAEPGPTPEEPGREAAVPEQRGASDGSGPDVSVPEQRGAADDDDEALAAASPSSSADGPGAQGEPGTGGEDAALSAELAERTDDLLRLQAEYVNYRKRVERDRLVARDQTVVAVVEAFIGVLDDLDSARAHGELDGTPFASVAEKFEAALAKFGWERFGAEGDAFDPQVHEALLFSHSTDVDGATVQTVLQPGHRVGDRVVRAARVAVVAPPD